MDTKKIFKHIPWVILGIIGAFCLSVVALRRGEHVSALWIVVASVSVYLVAYRYYSLYIAQKVMKLDPTRATPAVINNDGLNYVPTKRYVLFGHHFAAIAGAGPLVGPVLAAQMGYLPGTLWLLAAWCSRAQCRTLWCCSSLPAVTALSWRDDQRKMGTVPAPSRCSAAS
ncbi:carbon starvation protein [Salmonella enterica subsp. enterica]|uniref:Carbon starvation protein n=1 Tax=Salmonella enterica I TaxID=59201 RepID=A0A379V0M7_SALET|nr:carbon starvation protein [Salmonella enterica subsp. enterica]